MLIKAYNIIQYSSNMADTCTHACRYSTALQKVPYWPIPKNVKFNHYTSQSLLICQWQMMLQL